MPHRSNTSHSSVPYSDSDDSEDDEDEDEDMSESEEEESECSSYCSSDAEDMQERNIAVYDDTYGTRLSRVLAWRDNYAKAIGLLPDDSEYIILFFQLSEPTPPLSFSPCPLTRAPPISYSVLYPTCQLISISVFSPLSLPAELLSHTPHPMKRKIDYEDVFDDSVSCLFHLLSQARCSHPDATSLPSFLSDIFLF